MLLRLLFATQNPFSPLIYYCLDQLPCSSLPVLNFFWRIFSHDTDNVVSWTSNVCTAHRTYWLLNFKKIFLLRNKIRKGSMWDWCSTVHLWHWVNVFYFLIIPYFLLEISLCGSSSSELYCHSAMWRHMRKWNVMPHRTTVLHIKKKYLYCKHINYINLHIYVYLYNPCKHIY